jgi:nicotinamidase/pyrazinamidase
VCGLASDFCVFFSAIDARAAGFETAVALEASRAIDVDGSLDRALAAMRDAGVVLLD